MQVTAVTVADGMAGTPVPGACQGHSQLSAPGLRVSSGLLCVSPSARWLLSFLMYFKLVHARVGGSFATFGITLRPQSGEGPPEAKMTVSANQT